MNLSELAESDNSFILEDSLNGFAREIILENLKFPNPDIFTVNGQISRIGVDVDPDSGLMVPGSKLSVTFRLSSITPNIPDEGWTVKTTDISGNSIKSKVTSVMLDRTAGRATLLLRTR
jgi:hypothetical protein